MTKKEARAFQRRWAAVNRFEIAELRRMSPEQKLRQLAALMLSAESLGWGKKQTAEEAAVRRRWLRLKKPYGFGK